MSYSELNLKVGPEDAVLKQSDELYPRIDYGLAMTPELFSTHGCCNVVSSNYVFSPHICSVIPYYSNLFLFVM